MSLTAETSRRVAALFPQAEVGEVERLLVSECGSGHPSFEGSTPEHLERLRFAALKLSGGSIAELRRALALAREDWRDLLMAAGFGFSVDAHREWFPQRRE